MFHLVTCSFLITILQHPKLQGTGREVQSIVPKPGPGWWDLVGVVTWSAF